MKATATHRTLVLTVAAALVLAAGTFGTPQAGVRVEASWSSEPVDVRVWLDRGYDDYYGDYEEIGSYYDVYPSADDVVLYVRAARSCYTTVYVIDTEGYIHVVYPLSPWDDAYLRGGRVYRLWLRDYGFHRGHFGRGVAYAFAVSSPMPFAYANYGTGIFGPRVGFQIYGDPFFAARLFYLSILPPACHRGRVGVSYARFYVREYVRYPSYLCLGWNDPRGGHPHAAGACGAERQYRIHAKDPYRVLRPAGDPDRETARYTRIAPTGAKDAGNVRVAKPMESRVKDAGDVRVAKPVESRARDAGDVRAAKPLPAVRAKEPVPAERERTAGSAGAVRSVVRSTRESYVTSKRNYEKMREMYERSAGQDRVQVRQVQSAAKDPAAGVKNVVKNVKNVKSVKTTVVPRAANGARETVALGGASPRANAKSGKAEKSAR